MPRKSGSALPPAATLSLPAILAALRDRVPDRVSRQLEVCGCPVCMDDHTRARIIDTPMREMPADLVREYSNSAHGVPVNLDDLRAFLPRYLELIAAGEAVDYTEVGCELKRFGDARTRHPDLFDASETALLEAFAERLLGAALTQPLQPTPARPVYLAAMLAVGGWAPARLTAMLEAGLADPAAPDTALSCCLLDLLGHVRDGRVQFWAIEQYRPEAGPAFAALARRILSSERVLDLATAPPPSMAVAERCVLAHHAPHLRQLIA